MTTQTVVYADNDGCHMCRVEEEAGEDGVIIGAYGVAGHSTRGEAQGDGHVSKCKT